jgi:hypothetical protein
MARYDQIMTVSNMTAKHKQHAAIHHTFDLQSHYWCRAARSTSEDRGWTTCMSDAAVAAVAVTECSMILGSNHRASEPKQPQDTSMSQRNTNSGA